MRDSTALQSSLGLSNQGGESSHICNGDFAEHFPVQGAAGFFQSVHKAGIVDVVLLAGSADTGDPQSAEVSLLQLAAHISIPQGFHHLLVCYLKVVLFIAPIALGQFDNLFSSSARGHCAFYSCHNQNIHFSGDKMLPARRPSPVQWRGFNGSAHAASGFRRRDDSHGRMKHLNRMAQTQWAPLPSSEKFIYKESGA